MGIWKRVLIVTTKLVGGLVAVLIGIFVILYFLLHKSDVVVQRFGEVQSADNSYTLFVDVGNPSMPFGSHSIEISVANSLNEIIVQGQFKLSNDGANIGSDNIKLFWLDADTAIVCLRGDEQADVIISAQVSSQRIIEKDGAC